MSRANGVGARGKNQEHEPYWEVLCHYTARPGAGDISQAHQGSVRKSGNHTSLDPNQSVSHKGHFRSQNLAGSCSAQSSRRKPASPSSLAKRSASSLHSCVLRANLASCFCSVLGGPLKQENKAVNIPVLFHLLSPVQAPLRYTMFFPRGGLAGA
jgi:hypothetical protein